MKVAIVSSSDGKGGAPKATYRLHQGLHHCGVHSQMVVQSRTHTQSHVTGPRTKVARAMGQIRPTLDGLPKYAYPARESVVYSVQWLPDRLPGRVRQLQPNVVNLHWVCGGFVQIESIAKLNRPLVWTLHDMWPFTGGCHYSGDCRGYEHNCGVCPRLGSNTAWDLSRLTWQRKARAWRNVSLTVVTPSRWLAQCARTSTLFGQRRIEVIPNGIDTAVYKPLGQSYARYILNLPQEKPLILFGALNATADRRKGYALLRPALQQLQSSRWSKPPELILLGAEQSDLEKQTGFKTHCLGNFSDDVALALAYSAADIFVAPSLQENLPNTVLESLACGTPAVAFNIGGMPDLIEDQANGYLAEPYRVEDLANGMAWILQDGDRHQQLSGRARQKVEQQFSLELQAKRYADLYADVIVG